MDTTKAIFSKLAISKLTNRRKIYHVTQLKHSQYDSMRTDPADITRRDHHEFFVAEILSFRGDVNKVSTLTFRVKWLAYDESCYSWEQWRLLMNNEILHKYIFRVNLKNLIPRKFILNYTYYAPTLQTKYLYKKYPPEGYF